MSCTTITGTASYTIVYANDAQLIVPVDPATVAQDAVAQMALHAITIGQSPPPNSAAQPNAYGLVGLQVWLWAVAPAANTTGPITATATDGGVTVTATARLSSTIWDMGDGNSATCSGSDAPGTPWYGNATDTPMDSPTCGYTYDQPSTSTEQPNRSYTLTATSHWTIAWTSPDRAGTINLNLTANSSIQIRELEAIVTG